MALEGMFYATYNEKGLKLSQCKGKRSAVMRLNPKGKEIEDDELIVSADDLITYLVHIPGKGLIAGGSGGSHLVGSAGLFKCLNAKGEKEIEEIAPLASISDLEFVPPDTIYYGEYGRIMKYKEKKEELSERHGWGGILKFVPGLGLIEGGSRLRQLTDKEGNRVDKELSKPGLEFRVAEFVPGKGLFVIGNVLEYRAPQPLTAQEEEELNKTMSLYVGLKLLSKLQGGWFNTKKYQLKRYFDEKGNIVNEEPLAEKIKEDGGLKLNLNYIPSFGLLYIMNSASEPKKLKRCIDEKGNIVDETLLTSDKLFGKLYWFPRIGLVGQEREGEGFVLKLFLNEDFKLADSVIRYSPYPFTSLLVI